MVINWDVIKDTKVEGKPPLKWNGRRGTVDLTSPNDYIDDKNMYVKSGTDTISVVHSIAYAIHATQNFTETRMEIDNSVIIKAKSRIGNVLAVHALLGLLHICGVNMNLRSSDLKSIQECEKNPQYRNCYEAAEKIYSFTLKSPANAAKFAENAHLYPCMLVVNACHRKENNGHNLFTEDVTDIKSDGYKLANFAGRDKSKFRELLVAFGHDAFHCLNDGCIDDCADAITGHVPARVPPGTIYNASTIGAEEVHVHELLKTTEATVDRWPVGTLGISSLILGVDRMIEMFVDLKTKLINASTIVPQLSALRKTLEDKRFKRDSVTELRSRMGDSIAIAYGYACRTSKGEAKLQSNMSLVKFCKSRTASVATGKTIGLWALDAETDPEAIKTLVVDLFDTIEDSMRKVNATIDKAEIQKVPKKKFVPRGDDGDDDEDDDDRGGGDLSITEKNEAEKETENMSRIRPSGVRFRTSLGRMTSASQVFGFSGEPFTAPAFPGTVAGDVASLATAIEPTPSTGTGSVDDVSILVGDVAGKDVVDDGDEEGRAELIKPNDDENDENLGKKVTEADNAS